MWYSRDCFLASSIQINPSPLAAVLLPGLELLDINYLGLCRMQAHQRLPSHSLTLAGSDYMCDRSITTNRLVVDVPIEYLLSVNYFVKSDCMMKKLLLVTVGAVLFVTPAPAAMLLTAACSSLQALSTKRC